jgi:tRNA-dihydrouridine synthase
MILAPLRGVTIKTFRIAFADIIAQSGFTEAITPFIPANPGCNPTREKELLNSTEEKVIVTPQFIGKDPNALRECLLRIKDIGFTKADLNCGCPYPMIRRRNRGSGLLRTPDVLFKMIEAGCETMGDKNFSIKTRLGIDGNSEFIRLLPTINSFPLRFITVHARNAAQMYDGACDLEAFNEILSLAKMPVVYNGDVPFPVETKISGAESMMIGRSFIRYLSSLDNIDVLINKYIELSRRELYGDKAVLGRMKELFAYWKDLPRWRRLWHVIKITRSIDELKSVIKS